MFKNHFGMIVSMVIALILSLCMATAAIFVDSLEYNIPLHIKNWSVAFLTIILTTMIFPCKIWGDKLAGACKLKPNTLPFGLVSNIIPTFFYNTTATIMLVAVNIFNNPNIPTELQGGIFIGTVLHDWPIMFVIAYVLSLVSEKIAIIIAFKNVPPAVQSSQQNSQKA